VVGRGLKREAEGWLIANPVPGCHNSIKHLCYVTLLTSMEAATAFRSPLLLPLTVAYSDASGVEKCFDIKQGEERALLDADLCDAAAHNGRLVSV